MDKLTKGIEKINQALVPTYGPKGGNQIIEEILPPFFSVTNDGKAITDAVVDEITDPHEKLGAMVLKEATDKADRISGNGRKTTSILTYEILKEGKEAKDISPLALKKSLDECLPIIISSIDKQKKDISTDEIEGVATVASENALIGSKISQIYKHIGREGIIEIEPSNLPDTFYELIDGFRVHGAKMISNYSNLGDKAIWENPKILVCKDKIVSLSQVNYIAEKLVSKDIHELVIYCEDIELLVASELAKNHMKGKFRTIIIKSPKMFGKWLYEDVCAITGAKPVDSNDGRTFKSIEIEDLGTCEKIFCSPGEEGEVKIFGGKDISSHLEKIKENVKMGKKDEQMRLAWLQTKAAVLKMGAHSDAELSYSIKKAKDGCSSAYWALQDGVVEGGGVCLSKAAKDLPDTIGGKILKKALKVPQSIIGESDNIMDASSITKQCVKNAISIAGTVLTICGASIIPKELKETKRPFK